MTEAEKKASFKFFVDGKQYESTAESVTAATVKTIAGVTPTYQLFEETEGDTPDIALSDADGISLKGKEKHFFAVPPATFGALAYDATPRTDGGVDGTVPRR